MATIATGPVLGAAVGPIAQDAGVPVLAQTDVCPLPAGLPAKLDGDLAWAGADFKNRSDYAYVLGQADLDEIAKAVAFFKGTPCLPYLPTYLACPPTYLACLPTYLACLPVYFPVCLPVCLPS